MIFFAVALAVCVVLILFLRRAAYRLGVVDTPGGRKQHAMPTPTIGGLAMFVAVMLAVAVGGAFNGDSRVLLSCSAVLVILGLLDDKYGLAVGLRLMVQVVLALLIISGTKGTVTHLGDLFGRGDIRLGMSAITFSVIAYVGGINAINMIDGADGMAGKMAVATFVGLAIILQLSGAVSLLPLVWAMIGALLGFLLFNARVFVRRAWVFMGNAGSMWLGLMLAWFMTQFTRGDVVAEPALVLWLLGIPLIDTVAVMLRRLRKHRSPFSADRTHIHHVLLRAGLSVKNTVLILAAAQVAMVGAGVCFYLVKAPAAIVFWSFILLFAGYYYRLRNSVLKDRRQVVRSS